MSISSEFSLDDAMISDSVSAISLTLSSVTFVFHGQKENELLFRFNYKKNNCVWVRVWVCVGGVCVRPRKLKRKKGKKSL